MGWGVVASAVVASEVVASAVAASAVAASAVAASAVAASAVAAQPGRAAGERPPPAATGARVEAEAVTTLRRERQALEAQMARLQRTAQSLAAEVDNLEAQRLATTRLLEALDRQLAAINGEVMRTERALARTEAELTAKRQALRQRLVAVYKRGQLHAVEVLLSAQSFAGLVARYKYLWEAAAHDRDLVRRVERLRAGAVRQRRALEALRGAVQRTRAEKDAEAQRLSDLEGRRSQSLAAVTQSTERARERLVRLGGPQDGVAVVLAPLAEAAESRPASGDAPVDASRSPREAPRLELRADARSTVPALASTDRGRLEWPVDGGILYAFGKTQGRDRTTVRWNGVGIRAPLGAPVRAVAAGEVAVAGPVSSYGPTVIVQHGGGDYTVYGSLAQVAVQRGQWVDRGATLGTVGASDPALPAHLHFELRPKGRAVDPLPWLRRPAGARR
jgi:septal ring factor EnvC (AmiA/AmiB activator)